MVAPVTRRPLAKLSSAELKSPDALEELAELRQRWKSSNLLEAESTALKKLPRN
jgi:hypothetical protein